MLEFKPKFKHKIPKKERTKMIEIKCVGRLTKDIEFSQKDGVDTAKGCVAVNDKAAKDGESRQETVFLQFIVEGEYATMIQHRKKSDGMRLSGFLVQRHYTDKQGNKHPYFLVLAQRVWFIDEENFELALYLHALRKFKPTKISSREIFDNITGGVVGYVRYDGKVVSPFGGAVICENAKTMRAKLEQNARERLEKQAKNE